MDILLIFSMKEYHFLCEKGLPKDGITIFGSQLHTHGTGLRVASEHFRDGVPLPDINRDNHYSTHFQEIRELHEPKKIMPV